MFKNRGKKWHWRNKKNYPKTGYLLENSSSPTQISQSGPKYQHKRDLSGPEENYEKGQKPKPEVKVEKLPEKTLSKEGKRVKDEKRKGIGEVMDKENKIEKGQLKKGHSIKGEGETGEQRVNVKKKGDEDTDNKDKKGDEDREDQDKKEDEDSNKNKDKMEDEDKTKNKDMKGDEDKIKVTDIKEDEDKTENKDMKGDEDKTEDRDRKGDEDKTEDKDRKGDEDKEKPSI